MNSMLLAIGRRIMLPTATGGWTDRGPLVLLVLLLPLDVMQSLGFLCGAGNILVSQPLPSVLALK
jgi:hypothetical protein